MSLGVSAVFAGFLGEVTRFLRVEKTFFSGIGLDGFIMLTELELESTGFDFLHEKYCELLVDDKGFIEDMLHGDVSLILNSRFALGFWFLEEDRREFIDFRVRIGVNLLESDGFGMKLRDKRFSGDKSSERLFKGFFWKSLERALDIVYNDLEFK